ncbi:uncharacterized protein V1478_005370 [Vespula squamosa]|uniref:Uncharacterized protein n=1 Tax=Vespula squamosa TaxID=30214 RepID=A0ABD2BDX8_VESSQ
MTDNTNRTFIRSSIYINKVDNRCTGECAELQEEEYLKDILFVGGNEVNFGICADKNMLMERVWWLSKPPVVEMQIPAISARQIQIIKERLSPTIKKPRGLTETLRDKIKENLKQRSQDTKET